MASSWAGRNLQSLFSHEDKAPSVVFCVVVESHLHRAAGEVRVERDDSACIFLVFNSFDSAKTKCARLGAEVGD